MYAKYMKRLLDILLSLTILIVLSPLLLVLCILVRSKLGSPIFFKQERPGLHEKIFTMYKFRTMTDKRDAEGNLLPDKDRLTKFGKLLRATSLDELPEFFNILKGDMSFIGPRPLRKSRHTAVAAGGQIAQCLLHDLFAFLASGFFNQISCHFLSFPSGSSGHSLFFTNCSVPSQLRFFTFIWCFRLSGSPADAFPSSPPDLHNPRRCCSAARYHNPYCKAADPLINRFQFW